MRLVAFLVFVAAALGGCDDAGHDSPSPRAPISASPDPQQIAAWRDAAQAAGPNLTRAAGGIAPQLTGPGVAASAVDVCRFLAGYDGDQPLLARTRTSVKRHTGTTLTDPQLASFVTVANDLVCPGFAR